MEEDFPADRIDEKCEDVEDFTKNILLRAKKREELLTGVKTITEVTGVKTITEEIGVNATTETQESFGKTRTMKRLAELYTPDAEIQSPVHLHTELEKTPDILQPTNVTPTGRKSSPQGRLSRLSTLASNINAWEDDLTHICSPTSRFNISPIVRGNSTIKKFSSPLLPAPILPASIPTVPITSVSIPPPPITPTSISPVPVTLASTPSAPTLLSTPGARTGPAKSLFAHKVATKPPPPVARNWTNLTLSESRNDESPPMSVVERAKLFEKSGGLGHYVPRSRPSFAKKKIAVSPIKVSQGNVENQRKLFEREFADTDKRSTPASSRRAVSTPPQRSTPTRVTPKRCASPSPKSSPKAQYPGSRDVKRIKVKDPKPGHIYPSLTDIEATETETDAAGDDMDEDVDSSQFSEISDTSLGTYIQESASKDAVCSPIKTPKSNPYHRHTEDFSATLACKQIDDLIDDALDGQDYTLDTVIESQLCAPSSSTPISQDNDNANTSRQLRSGNNWRKSTEIQDLTERDVSSVKQIASEDSDTVVGQDCESTVLTLNKDSSSVVASSPIITPNAQSKVVAVTPKPSLIHTVSVYRKQQVQNSTPRATMIEKRSPSPPQQQTANIQDRIRALEDEVQGQQRSIAQISKALSICKATIEFSESTENVECERVLLISTHKRTALLNEIHRIKTEGVLTRNDPPRNDLGPSSKGSMEVKDISVRLRRDFTRSAGNMITNFICLLKYRDQVQSTPVVSVGANSTDLYSINFGQVMKLSNLDSDFRAKLDIFMIQTLAEFLPHETKYHIKKENKISTPKKGQAGFPKILSRGLQSPAGPDAVRSTNFKLCGSLSIDISTLQRQTWKLECPRTPLEGDLTMNIICNSEGGVEESGFLTLFNDVSGFGAWHRRWCRLTSTELSFWMYPVDETRKPPMDTIELRHCSTSRVGPVPRDVCARANTFLLVTTRSRQEGDKDSLVTSCHSDYTAIRHLISADMKEDRDNWCAKLNKALANLRAWDSRAQAPNDSLF